MTVTCASPSPTFTSAWVWIMFDSSTSAVCVTAGGLHLVTPVLWNKSNFPARVVNRCHGPTWSASLDASRSLITDTGVPARWMSEPNGSPRRAAPSRQRPQNSVGAVAKARLRVPRLAPLRPPIRARAARLVPAAWTAPWGRAIPSRACRRAPSRRRRPAGARAPRRAGPLRAQLRAPLRAPALSFPPTSTPTQKAPSREESGKYHVAENQQHPPDPDPPNNAQHMLNTCPRATRRMHFSFPNLAPQTQSSEPLAAPPLVEAIMEQPQPRCHTHALRARGDACECRDCRRTWSPCANPGSKSRAALIPPRGAVVLEGSRRLLGP